VGECGAQLQPLVYALTAELLRHAVLHAGETPVSMLKPGNKKTHKAYMWTYCTTSFDPVKAVVFNFAETRSGENVRSFLRQDGEQACELGWTGTLVTDGFSGYKATFERGVTEAGCVAHARRIFHELWANHGSKVGEQALKFFGALYDVEREVADADGQPGQARRATTIAPGSRCAAPVDAPAAAEDLGRLSHRPGDRLQPQPLGGADALPGRRRRADLEQLG